MEDVDKIKGRIKDTIYSNGRGAITALPHQRLLLDIADFIETKAKKTAVPTKISQLENDVLIEHYIPDFTMSDIRNAYDDKLPLRVDTMSLYNAVASNKTILIRESNDFHGLNVCSAYIEDMLYIRILGTSEIISLKFDSALSEELRWENIFFTEIYGKLMQATPSGDPMHYMFEEAGAEYNATDSDIAKYGIYGDMIYHRAHRWYLNEIGDLTTEEMRGIYAARYAIAAPTRFHSYFRGARQRTNLSVADGGQSAEQYQYVAYGSNFKTLRLSKDGRIIIVSANNLFRESRQLVKVLDTIDTRYLGEGLMASFQYMEALEEIRIQYLSKDVTFPDSPNLSVASVLYMIDSEQAQSPITITLHPTAYRRAIEDAVTIDVLNNHPNVSLASA